MTTKILGENIITFRLPWEVYRSKWVGFFYQSFLLDTSPYLITYISESCMGGNV